MIFEDADENTVIAACAALEIVGRTARIFANGDEQYCQMTKQFIELNSKPLSEDALAEAIRTHESMRDAIAFDSSPVCERLFPEWDQNIAVIHAVVDKMSPMQRLGVSELAKDLASIEIRSVKSPQFIRFVANAIKEVQRALIVYDCDFDGSK